MSRFAHTNRDGRRQLVRARLTERGGYLKHRRSMKPGRLLSTLLAAALAGACGGGDDAPPRREATPLDTTTTGTIAGTVRFEGAVPPMSEINFGSFAECAAVHDTPVLTNDALVRNGKVQNAIVYVKEGLGDRTFAAPETPVAIDQHGCLYEPRVAGAQVGQPIVYKNSDRTLHNVHGKPEASGGWNFALSRQGSERAMRIDHAEVAVSVRCDLHPWMQGWIGVFDHPYFAVTGPDGAFSLANLPPGTYVIAAWHERLGTAEHTVTLAARGAETVDLALE
jgi:plastocyanin